MLISDKWDATIAAERAFEWKKWADEIPFLQFPAHWKVKIIPPLVGAIIRFRVTTNNKNHVSVYLDCYDHLGYFGEPYWEIYPDKEDNNSRYRMNDAEALIKAISESLEQQTKEASDE